MNSKKTDISDHLESMYVEIMKMKPVPQFIVELGVRGGESTVVFDYVNKEIDTKLVSVDLEECEYKCSTNGTFVQADDTHYADVFREVYGSVIDLLFIDTSHIYWHTKQELEKWIPLLNEKATVMFHDTNLKEKYFRKDGEECTAWDNKRGVTRAIEEYFDIKMTEEREFSLSFEWNDAKWSLKHVPYCCGFTIISKNTE